MPSPTIKRQDVVLGATYFGLGSLALALTRFDGGVAFLWVAAAALIAVLMVRPRRNWPGAFATCGIASFLATGLFGLGWGVALPFAMLNMVEAYVAARLLRQFGYSRSPLGSMRWLGHFVLSVGIVGPLAGATIASLVLFVARHSPPIHTVVNFFAGHALGNLTFIPIITLFVGGRRIRRVAVAKRRSPVEIAGLLGAILATTIVVFAQRGMPLLFLPMLPLILATFRLGEVGAAVGIAILGLAGGFLTCTGRGPIMLDGEIGHRVQFFQFYLASAVMMILPVAADLRNRARLHRQVRLSEERYRLLADHSTDVLLHVENDGRIRFISPSIQRLGGYDPDELIGRYANVLIAADHRESTLATHRAAIKAHGDTVTSDYIAITSKGEERWFETHSRAVVDEDGQVDGVLSIVRDISERKAREMKLTEAALTDPLTSLANRRALYAAIEGQDALGMTGDRGCIALIDLDYFKRINDRWGHDAGDAVLRTFASVACRHMRQGDVTARIGGEEFALFLPATSIDQARLICERLRTEMAATPTLFGGDEIHVTVSGGVAPLGQGGVDFALRVADAALYRAKNNGRDQMAVAA